MDIGLRTPLLDLFRTGEVTPDVRLLAAQGTMSPSPLEQLALLALLTSDDDGEIRRVAEETLSKIPAGVLSRVIAGVDVPSVLREFFANRGVAAASAAEGDVVEALLDDDGTDYGVEPVTEEEKLSLLARLASMGVPEKVKAAMKGSREMRAVLIRDPNKMVSRAVLSSPKLSDAEVEMFARMGSVGEDVLRTIAQSRAWTKNYGVVSALVKNAKTPVTLSMMLINRLSAKDIKALCTNRNIPEALRLSAKKRISEPQK
jgi:hypothetical protein